MKTQLQMISEALKKGRKITPRDAYTEFGCFRLASRIDDLRKSGMHVITNHRTENGKTFAEYYLKEVN